MKSICRIVIHTKHLLLNMDTEHIFSFYNHELGSTLQLIFKVGQKWLSRLKQPVSPFLEVDLKKLVDSHM